MTCRREKRHATAREVSQPLREDALHVFGVTMRAHLVDDPGYRGDAVAARAQGGGDPRLGDREGVLGADRSRATKGAHEPFSLPVPKCGGTDAERLGEFADGHRIVLDERIVGLRHGVLESAQGHAHP